LLHGVCRDNRRYALSQPKAQTALRRTLTWCARPCLERGAQTEHVRLGFQRRCTGERSAAGPPAREGAPGRWCTRRPTPAARGRPPARARRTRPSGAAPRARSPPGRPGARRPSGTSAPGTGLRAPRPPASGRERGGAAPQPAPRARRPLCARARAAALYAAGAAGQKARLPVQADSGAQRARRRRARAGRGERAAPRRYTGGTAPPASVHSAHARARLAPEGSHACKAASAERRGGAPV